MLRTLLLGVIVVVVSTSPELRSISANGLRMAASWIEPKDGPQESPKYIQIPNPFFLEKEQQ